MKLLYCFDTLTDRCNSKGGRHSHKLAENYLSALLLLEFLHKYHIKFYKIEFDT